MTESAYFHIVLRSMRRDVLARDARDRRALNAIAIEAMRRYDVLLHGYCLLPQQLRVLIEVDKRLVSKALRRVVTRYGRYRLPNRSRGLFERPYIVRSVDSPSEFLSCLRSMHLAPIRAHAAVTVDDYLWSSHPAYRGYRSNALITTEYALSLLDANCATARSAYRKFVAAGLETETPVRPHDAERATRHLAIY